MSTVLNAIRGLRTLKSKLETTHKLQLSAVDDEISNLQKSCSHENGRTQGWEGGRYFSCPDCGFED